MRCPVRCPVGGVLVRLHALALTSAPLSPPPLFPTRQLLWTVDQGKAADTSGVPDPDLRARLQGLLGLLRLRKNSKVGLGSGETRPGSGEKCWQGLRGIGVNRGCRCEHGEGLQGL